MKISTVFIYMLVLCLMADAIGAFTSLPRSCPSRLLPPTSPAQPSSWALAESSSGGSQEDANNTSSLELENGIEKDLLFPALTLRKESILFGENPATRSNSNALRAWRATKQCLPFLITGARTPNTADDNPVAGFYNMIFVRIPTLAAGLVYAKNALTGHPLVIDVGSGPTEVNPVLVAATLFIILR